MHDLSSITTSKTGGDAVCAALERLGVRTVFGIPSQQKLASALVV